MYLVDAETYFKHRHRSHQLLQSLWRKDDEVADADKDNDCHQHDNCGAGVGDQKEQKVKSIQRDLFSRPFSKIIGFRRNMAATDGQIILAASRFGDTPPVYLRDFSRTELPAIAKIVKGQHQNLGVPTLSNPSLQSTALFLNAGKKYQILAQPIKIKEGRKTTNVGEWDPRRTMGVASIFN